MSGCDIYVGSRESEQLRQSGFRDLCILLGEDHLSARCGEFGLRARDVRAGPQLGVDKRVHGTGEDGPSIHIGLGDAHALFGGQNGKRGIRGGGLHIEQGQLHLGGGTGKCGLRGLHVRAAITEIEWLPGNLHARTGSPE